MKQRFCIAMVSVSMLGCILLFTGCSEEDKAEAKELWLGVPNKTPPRSTILEVEADDPPEVRAYKEKATEIRLAEYQKMSGKQSIRQFAEKADAVDLDNIRDLLRGRSQNHSVDTHFSERPELYAPRPERRYTRMDFEQSQYGDMYRMGGAMQDLGNEMMRQGAIQQERKAIAEARGALNTYVLKMDKVKMSLFTTMQENTRT